MDGALDDIRAAAGAGLFVAAGVVQPDEWAAISGVVIALYKLGRNALHKGGFHYNDPRAIFG
jgi:hypothetical protein